MGALIGNILGELLGSMISHSSLFYKIFVKGIAPGLKPTTLDLKIVNLTFGFNLKLNLVSIIGIVIALILFKRIS